jgi:hypothetical protein
MALQQFNLKLLPETIELWKKSFENSEAETGNEFTELLLEKFLNPKVKEIEVFKLTPEKEQEFQNLVNEIGRLKTAATLLQDRILELETQNAELTTQNAELETRSQQPGTLTLEDNQEIITIPPKVAAVIEIEQQIAQKKTGQPFTRAEILLQSFWASIVTGVAYPWKVWSNSEIQSIEKKLAAQQPAANE